MTRRGQEQCRTAREPEPVAYVIVHMDDVDCSPIKLPVSRSMFSLKTIANRRDARGDSGRRVNDWGATQRKASLPANTQATLPSSAPFPVDPRQVTRRNKSRIGVLFSCASLLLGLSPGSYRKIHRIDCPQLLLAHSKLAEGL